MSDVSAWSETVIIPTYGVGQPDPNPMFLEKRVYQGSSGAVYPLPVIERVDDERRDVAYTAVFLENAWIKLMVLPELGGRIQQALNKTNGHHFVYANRVIKPALVGLNGPWISGGIEFNWPQHHRPTTFMPLDWSIEHEPDGACVVWCGEIEPMTHTRGVHGIRLRPDRAAIEVDVRLSNRTSLPQTFLWWANPAVHVSDQYQSVFPPDVHAVMDHGKRDVSAFPIATGTYYKVNYAPGTDISRYSTIPVPTSYMAHHSDYDFVGCYDHGLQAGMMHVANHHVVPGKKQWTWGTSDFGVAWQRQLTDDDGPYIELMCGAYTDNQPDFAWLHPGEVKHFVQTFMPYRLIGAATNANRDAVVRLAVHAGLAEIGVYSSMARVVRVEVWHGTVRAWSREVALDPTGALRETVALPADAQPHEVTLRVFDGDVELIRSTPPAPGDAVIPAPATPARAPADIASVEELFLNGLHLEQYRHATRAPEPYYQEGLRRDPGDSRCNTALGVLLLRRSRFAEAVPYLRRATERLTLRNPNPADGEPFYYLGLALLLLRRDREATDALYKASWNAAWQAPACFELARLAARAGRLDEALELTGRALEGGVRQQRARHLRIALLRRLGQRTAALAEASRALAYDALDPAALHELRWLGAPAAGPQCRGDAGSTMAVALDYVHAGLFAEALDLLDRVAHTDPLASYLMGWCHALAGDPQAAHARWQAAAALPPAYCFPNLPESALALEAARQHHPDDPRAPYYLGIFWYARRHYQAAIACWESARALDPNLATVHRNLGLAYVNQLGDHERAHAALLQALACDPGDARIFYECDQLEKRLGRDPVQRLARLQAHPALVARRDDLVIEQVSLLNRLDRPAEAYALLMSRTFHPWEGGEGKVTGQYVACLVQLARHRLAHGDAAGAITALEEAQIYPPRLGEGKLHGAQENHIFYELGRAHRACGQHDAARAAFERAAIGLSEPTSAVYYNDQPPDMLFYQGAAAQQLGRHEHATQIFERLIAYGQAHMNDDVTIDYFAVSLPDFLVFDDDPRRRHRIHCAYMCALGHLGLGQHSDAKRWFAQVLRDDPSHLGAATHERLC